jgi:hypothetical protein
LVFHPAQAAGGHALDTVEKKRSGGAHRRLI